MVLIAAAVPFFKGIQGAGMQLKRYRYFSPLGWAGLILISAFLVVASAQALADQAPIFSVTQISDSGEGGEPRMAVYWNGELPVELIYGREDDSGSFGKSGNAVLLEEKMSLLPAPGNPQSTVFRVRDASHRTLAEYRQESPLYGWQSDFVGPGLGWGEVNALTTFQGELIIAGRFVFADDKLVNKIARWNGSEWQTLEGPDGIGLEVEQFLHPWTRVWAMQVYQNKLVVSGTFTKAGGVPADGLALWDGNQWTAFEDNQGARFNGQITRMTIFNGELIVSGGFTTIDDLVVNRIARWNGSTWLPLAGPSGTGLSSGASTFAEFDGNLVVGGHFIDAGGVEVDRIAVWDGSNWSRLEGDGVPSIQSGGILSLANYNGDLIAGGSFQYIADTYVSNIARWDGTQWHAMTGPGGGTYPGDDVGLSDMAYSMIAYEGNLIVGGEFVGAGGIRSQGVAVWNGQYWSTLESLEHEIHSRTAVNSLIIHDDILIAGGQFPRLGNQISRNIARWNIDHWSALESAHATGIQSSADNGWSTIPTVNTIVTHDDYLFVGGKFSHTGRQESHNIARWDGTTWIDMPGITGLGWARVTAMISHHGNLYAAGDFRQAGPVDAKSIARWDGSQWHALNDPDGNGLEPGSRVNALAIFNDEIIVAGRFTAAGGATVNSIARWNGQHWLPLTGPKGTGITSSYSEVFALAVVNDELVVGGSFSQAGGIEVEGIARWNGGEWQRMGPEQFEPVYTTVRALIKFQDQLHVAGSFRSAGEIELDGIARWSGSEWLPLEDQSTNPLRGWARTMHVHEDRLIVAGQTKRGPGPIFNDIAAWDGQRWSAFTGPRRTGFAYDSPISPSALATHNGDLYAGGDFLVAGGAPAWALSRYLENPVQVQIEEIIPQFSDPGQDVRIFVSVSGSTPLPESGIGLVSSDTGHLCMADNITPNGSNTLTFSCDLNFEESGLHELTAYFDSPTDSVNSLSQPVVHGVKSLSSTTGFVQPAGSQNAGQLILFTGRVTGPFDPEGTVVIDVDGRTICTLHNTSDFGCINVLNEIGERQVTFTYSGDDLHFPSSHSQIYTITEPLLEFSPYHLDFGVVDVGLQIPTGVVTLTNRSESVIEVTAIKSATAPFHDHPDSDCPIPPFSLQPDSSCLLVYSFEPVASGDFSRQILVTSDLPTGWHFFRLIGTGHDELMHDRFEVGLEDQGASE